MNSFSVIYINDIAKIAIVFTNKIRVHVWPKSGKVNIFGSKAELTGALIREFIRNVFMLDGAILFVIHLLLR